MDVAKIFEALMLITFGASWPAQIVKTVRVKNPKGKSFLFLILILSGYVCGIISKFVGEHSTGFRDWVLYIYLLDLLMVATDLFFSLYYLRKLDKKQN